MIVLLIRSGVVENCINADSVARAAQFYPAPYLCLQKTGLEGVGWTYDGVSFFPPASVPVSLSRRITLLAFWLRFTDAEYILIDLASIGATQAAARVRRVMMKLNLLQMVNLNHPDVRTAVFSAETAGYILPGRALVILDTPPTDGELGREV